jgi:hypothetical protein
MGMGRIFHQPDPIFLADLLKLPHPARHDTADVNHDDARSPWRQAFFDILWPYAKGFRVHIDKDRLPTRMHDGSRRSEEGIGGNQDILSFHAQYPQNDFKSAGATVDDHPMAASAELGELFLKLGPIFAQGELPTGQDFDNPFSNPCSIFRQELNSGRRDRMVPIFSTCFRILNRNN